MKKTLPTITWQNLAPPYYDYDYFQGCEHYPFHPISDQFDVVNAWWLSEIASLVYAEEDFAKPRFQNAGLPEVKYFDGESTDCFVASNDDWIIVAFRGTESRTRSGTPNDFQHIIADIKADCNILLVDATHGGKVHQGFNDALDEVWESLLNYMRSIHHPPRPLWITGHSLGAALATLAADRYREVQGVYTFGSPRVGDAGFKEQFSVKTYRIVNNNDIVSSIPPPGIYRHVGEQWYIDSEGMLHQDIPRSEMWMDEIRGEMRNIMNSVEQVSQGTFNYVPGVLKDHVPILYAIDLWNNLLTMEGSIF